MDLSDHFFTLFQKLSLEGATTIQLCKYKNQNIHIHFARFFINHSLQSVCHDEFKDEFIFKLDLLLICIYKTKII